MFAASSARPQMQLWLAQGDLASATRWAENWVTHGGSRSALGREWETVALVRLLLAQDRPEDALTRLAPLRESASQQGRWGSVIQLRLLQAEAESLLRMEQAALATLAQAVELAEPEGYLRSFVDEGPPMAALLRRLWEQERRRGPTPYLDKLLAAFPLDGAPPVPASFPGPPQQGLIDPLSPRELDVLQQLARGASNQEIAEALVITVDTVKHHVGNILGKLQANNRTQAVAHGRALGLLSDEEA
jgi:LuxR family transcriptional regulator, maltose regulon positive regulatory protein